MNHNAVFDSRQIEKLFHYHFLYLRNVGSAFCVCIYFTNQKTKNEKKARCDEVQVKSTEIVN